MIRGQYQRAVRAPSVDELFRSNSTISEAATDPCALPTAATPGPIRDLCIATGVPPAVAGNSGIQPNFQLTGIVGGNPDLEAEPTDTYTLDDANIPMKKMDGTVDYTNYIIQDTLISAPLNNTGRETVEVRGS